MCVCACSRSPPPLRGALLALSGVLPTRHYSHSCLLMVLLMVNKLLYAYASHCSITYRCSSVLERIGGATLHLCKEESHQVCNYCMARNHVRHSSLRAIFLPGLVADAISRAGARAFRHQARKEAKYSSHAVHVIHSARLRRPVVFSTSSRCARHSSNYYAPDGSTIMLPLMLPKHFGTEAASRDLTTTPYSSYYGMRYPTEAERLIRSSANRFTFLSLYPCPEFLIY
jgi:hypothetical protein